MTSRLVRASFFLAVGFALVPAALPARAQEGGGANGSAAASEEGDAGGFELPLIGRIELPAWLGGGSSEEADGEGAAGGASSGAEEQAADPNAPPPAVIVETVETRSVGQSFDFIGTITPIERVGVRARVEGYIQEVDFGGAQYVSAGDLLFQIEPAQYEAALAAARGQQAGAQATLNQAQRDFDRQNELAQSGVTARAALDTARAQFENAQAALLQANAAVTQAELDLSYTRITAAIDGEMSAPIITRGNYVSASSGDLATLTQMDPIWGVFPIGENQLATWQRVGLSGGEEDAPPITASAPSGDGGQGSGAATGSESAAGPQREGAGQGEEDTASATNASAPSGDTAGAGGETPVATAEGTAAEGAVPPPPGSEVDERARADDSAIADDYELRLRLPNGAPYQAEGDFEFVSNTVNASTGTVEVRISFPNPGGFLLANQNVTLVASERNPPMLPVVPQAAVQLSREGRSVLLVREDDTIEKRSIEVGQSLGNDVAVTRGLEGGERVVVRGSANVQDGTKVTPQTAEQAEASRRSGSQGLTSGEGAPSAGEGGGSSGQRPEGGAGAR